MLITLVKLGPPLSWQKELSCLVKIRMNGTQYAPAWCNAYDRSYDKGDEAHTKIGIGAGQWWLPSIAELIIIWKHKYAINQCLSVISGASPLVESWHWSSTENSAANAWDLTLYAGLLHGWYTKVSNSNYVRAVAAFLRKVILRISNCSTI